MLRIVLTAWCLLLVAVLQSADFPVPGFTDPAKWAKRGGSNIERSDDGIVFSGPVNAFMSFEPSLRDATNRRQYQGIVFRVRGRGTGGKHRFVLGVADGKFRFAFMFEGSEWREVRLAWSDFVNVSRDLSLKLGETGIDGLPPEGIFQLQLGDDWRLYHGNSKIQPYQVEVADMPLTEKVTPIDVLKSYPQSGLEEAIVKMESGKRVLIYCDGDSITAGTGVGENRYPNFLQEKLRKYYKNTQIEVKTIAVGGAQSSDLRVWARSDFFEAAPPDLVTVMVGYNDRWLAVPCADYKTAMAELCDRINSYTKGAPLILFATAPGVAERYEMLDKYATAIRELALERQLPCFDLNSILKKIGPSDLLQYYFDRAHPNVVGHELIANELSQFIINYRTK